MKKFMKKCLNLPKKNNSKTAKHKYNVKFSNARACLKKEPKCKSYNYFKNLK